MSFTYPASTLRAVRLRHMRERNVTVPRVISLEESVIAQLRPDDLTGPMRVVDGKFVWTDDVFRMRKRAWALIAWCARRLVARAEHPREASFFERIEDEAIAKFRLYSRALRGGSR